MGTSVPKVAAKRSATPSLQNVSGSNWLSRLTPYFMVAPVVFIVGAGLLLGAGNMFNLSFQEHSLIRPDKIGYIGLENYTTLLNDNEFWRSLKASVIWVAGSVIPQFLLGLGLALILNEKFRGRGLFRVITIVPWAVSGVVTGIMWLWLFDGTIGVINDLLMKVNLIDRPIPWAIKPEGSFFMLFVANAWRGTPFFAIMFLAALQGINPDFYESAKIDGANGWQRFRFITLPLIRQTIIISTMLRVIWTFNYVDIIFTMTQGGPLKSTRTMTLYIYDTAFLDFDFGYAATLAAVTMILLMVFTVVYWRLGGASEDVY